MPTDSPSAETERIWVAHIEVAKFPSVADRDLGQCAEKAAEHHDLPYRATDIENWTEITKRGVGNPRRYVFNAKDWRGKVGLHPVEVERDIPESGRKRSGKAIVSETSDEDPRDDH